ncbi:MAG TPA: penicillin-binding protein, partial [Alteromonas sp.]|nr:penicillin-binding protein [Alteromonas sp.]
MQSAIEAETPGCNLGIMQKGEFLHKAGYGLANLELNVLLDGNQVHRMASVSKQFTAMAVLMLVEQGKIDLDQDIHIYLP